MKVALLVTAALPVVLCPLLSALGARGGLSVISGTVPAEPASILIGLSYAAFWFCACTISPIVALAIAFDTYLSPGCAGAPRRGLLRP